MAAGAPARKVSEWVHAVVLTDGASVYARPDFDAPVLDYLSVKAPVWAIKKAAPGRGGLGLFYRVHYRNKDGYLADTDIRFVSGEAAKAPDHPKKAKAAATSEKRDDQEDARSQQPIYFTRYAGGALAYTHFTEKFSGRKFSDHITMYGLRLTGPGALFDGPPIDFNVWFSTQKPSYYKQFNASASGFMLFGDIMAMLPLREWNNTLVNFGLGMMWTYTQYDVMVKNSKFDSRELRLGADVDLGVAYRFRPYAVRLDAKYYWEKTNYVGYVASFQVEY